MNTPPYLSFVSALLLIAAYPISYYLSEEFRPRGDYYGFGQAGIMILSLFIFLIIGALTGSLSIHRKEHPRVLSIVMTLLNILGIIGLLLLVTPALLM